jgi:hypothetical protein
MKKLTFAFIVLALLLAACTAGIPTNTSGSSTPTPAPAPNETTPTPVDVPASSTPAPSATPAPGKVLLFAPNTDSGFAPAVKSRLAELASAAALTLVPVTSLAAADLAPEVRIVLLLAEPDNLTGLLSAAPQVQFLAVGLPGLSPGANLSVITPQPEQVAFVAGFIATIISEDWRSAGLLPDTPASIQDAFVNGGRYFCGRCVPIHGPIVLFPVAAALPAGSSLDAWQSAVTQLQTNILETVYVDPTISSPDLLSLLAKQNLALVGGQTPSADISAQWAATVTSDVLAPLNTLWPGLLAGKGNQSLAAAVQVTDINASLLTPGKQRLMQDVIAGLQDGTIGASSIP